MYIIIRFDFEDNLLELSVEGRFIPTESTAALYDLLKNEVLPPDVEIHIFFTVPPSEIQPSRSSSLKRAGISVNTIVNVVTDRQVSQDEMLIKQQR